jgi:hypothetical protein
MRKLFTGILLAAALPASANIATDLEAGLSADAAIANAVAACDGGATCQELAIEEALAAGIDLDSVISAAIASGVNAADAQQAAIDAGQSESAVQSAVTTALANLGTTNPTAAGNTGTGFNVAPQSSSTQTNPPLTSNTGVSPGN